ncbi:MAG: N-acetylneuraminate synthase [Erysipelotrichaceae bacterium]|nr:N-acetylneuraminate synthase [Erysipelotrichaceae bacterium]
MMKTLIIAEAGVNHNGNFELAKKLVDKAVEAGADIVKFQTCKAENVISRYADKAEYQKVTTGDADTQLDMVRKLMLTYEEYGKLKDYCDERGIGFLSTAFDLPSVDYLHSIGMKLWKIPSGEITNLPLLIKIAELHEPIIMSTGMSELKEVGEAVKVLKEHGAGEITLLHCTTEYPAPYADVNLKAMETMKEAFGLPVGYSDHTKGIEIPTAAVALGACVIEKHFTLDRNMEGPDHKASVEPQELKAMVEAIRHTEVAIGDGVKRVSASELKNQDIARKSIIAAKAIRKGDVFTEDNVTTKRPGSGLNPMRWFELLGKTAKHDYEEDYLIEKDELDD